MKTQVKLSRYRVDFQGKNNRWYVGLRWVVEMDGEQLATFKRKTDALFFIRTSIGYEAAQRLGG